MKRLSLACTIVLALFAAACSNSASPEKESGDSTDVETGAEEKRLLPAVSLMPDWVSYLQTQDPSFDASAFEDAGAGSMQSVQNRPVDSASVALFSPYLLFNEDSSYALDLVSYNFVAVRRGATIRLEEGGPDFEVSMIDMEKGASKRLLFFGSSGAAVLDARWAGDAVWIAGAIDWQNRDSLRPVLWKYVPQKQELQTFTYPTRIRADWSAYPKELYDLKR